MVRSGSGRSQRPQSGWYSPRALQLHVEFQAGRKHLPIVTLKRAV
jgi:hypothetical protein